MTTSTDSTGIHLTIDGMKVSGKPDQTILEVARENGIEIPTLCSHAKLSPTGACRICVVDVGRKDRLEAACTTPITSNMVVSTRNERVIASRRAIMELMLDNLTVDVHALEKDGGNVLLELAHGLGILVNGPRLSRLKGLRGDRPTDARNPVIVKEPNKCILCGRCVSACNDLRHYGVLNYEGRGYETGIISGTAQPLLESGCASCGECVEVCPTGAFRLMAREKVQGVIDSVIGTGAVYSASASMHANRSKLGLPPLEEGNAADLAKIVERTRTRSDKANGGAAK